MRASVVYWEKWGGNELEAVAAAVRAFNESQRAFEVDLSSTGDWSSSPDIDGFLEAERAGHGPDLIGLEASEVAKLAAVGALQPISGPAAERANEVLRKDVARLGVWCDVRYAVPVVADLVTLYVNTAATRGTPFEMGVPRALSEFDAAMEVAAWRGRIPFVPAYPGWWPEVWPLFFGGGWFDGRGRFTPERAENRRAYEWIIGLKDRFALEKFRAELCPFGKLQPEPFFSGEVALVLEGDWLVQRLIAEPELAWTVAPFPTADGRGGALLEADLVGIAAGAQCADGAAAFLEFLTQAAWIERLALGQGKVSPLLSWSSEYLAQHHNPKLADLRAIWDRVHVFAPPQAPEWWSLRQRIRDAFHRMWCDGAPVPETLADLAHDEAQHGRGQNC